jgi:hypothetical protein
MLKVKFLFLCLLVSLAFQAQEISGEHTFRCIDIKNVEIVAENFVAEIDFGPIIKVVSGKSIKKHKSARLAKDEAYFNAIVDNEIDVLIDPIYAVRKKGKFLFVFGGYAEATVVGFAGYYKNVLPESQANSIIIDNYLNDFINFSVANHVTPKMVETETIIEDKDCKDCKEKAKLKLVTTKQQSVIDLYEKSKMND